MTENKVRTIVGAVVIGVSFFAALLLSGLFCRTWRNKHGKFLFFEDNARNETYLANRSLIAWLGLGAYCVFEMTVLRAINVPFEMWHKSLFGSRVVHVSMIGLAHGVLLSITLARCWRLRVRHMYYVVLRNAGIGKLMDPSVGDSLSFWVKYKAILTSNIGALAMVLVYIFLVVFLIVYFHENLTRARLMLAAVAIITSLASVLLLHKIPHNRDFLKRELQMCATVVLLTYAAAVICVAVLGDTAATGAILQSLATFMDATVFLLSFYLCPRRVQRTEESAMELVTSRSRVRRKVFEVFKNTTGVTAFAQHCSDHFCVENVLAILEIKEFKRTVRKELAKDLTKKEMVRDSAVATDETEMKKAMSLSSAASLSANDGGNEALYNRATRDRNLSIEQSVCEEWTRWDKAVFVKLSQLGCRSAIVESSGDARSKALALCSKYFEWDSDFTLNLSYDSRSKVLAIVGKDATVELESEALLFVFDDAIRDVFDNLSNAIDGFRFDKNKTMC